MDTGLDSQGDQYPVYVGIWTNWSRGRVMGSTLTLRRRDADLLIAFTAFFIAFVTTRAWRILCFMFHRFYSTADPRDALYHQRQTILRNSSSPESGIQMLLWLLWANRRSKGGFRPLPAAVVAFVCVSIFTVAGGFSSQISTAIGNEVLIKSSNCGYTPMPGVLNNPFFTRQLANRAITTNAAANYAQQCYSNDKTGLLDCGRFITKKVENSKINIQASCPFRNNICRNESTNLLIDSGYIDSHDILGLNAPPNERILLRNVLHCAPLTTTGFAREANTSVGMRTLYHYGNQTSGNGEEVDYIHAAPSVESQYAVTKSNDIITVYGNYALSSFYSGVNNKTTFKKISNFYPIDDIARSDADLSLFFLSGNGVAFPRPSDDQWYRLNTVPSSLNLGAHNPGTEIYLPQEPASPLGCANQYQFCNTAFQGTDGCGPLASLRDAIAGAIPFFFTANSRSSKVNSTSETGARLIYFTNNFFSTSSSEISTILGQLGPVSLTSQKTLFGGIQGPIASNQWQRDVSHWWDISMAAQQSALLDSAYIADNSDVRASRVNYTTPELQKLCNNQKIRSTAYASFSLFGLFFTLAVGVLLTLVSYLLEPVSEWLHKRKCSDNNKYPYLEWVANATLQLQRFAHEEAGFGTWSEGTGTIPMTKAGELLGSLDITDPSHPVLRRSMNGDGAPLSTKGTAQTENTAIGSGSEHTDITPAPSTHASGAEREIDRHPQEDLLAGDEMRIEERGPTAHTTTVIPRDDTPSGRGLDHIIMSIYQSGRLPRNPQSSFLWALERKARGVFVRRKCAV
ncbi:hypothetical protein NUW58_g6714 [Xylaria curta]|uniref:Uncharacterized protein n=1 Tax=Xylaria curta TaxID=42375 RepID=A0ACC1NRX1_9PEZI|nr:hypothetical protein NUW58_g6714 [Xylaria curta]